MSVLEKINILCGNDNLIIFSFKNHIKPCNQNYCVDGVFCWGSGRCSSECAAILFLTSIIDEIKNSIFYKQKKSFFVITCLQNTDVFEKLYD